MRKVVGLRFFFVSLCALTLTSSIAAYSSGFQKDASTIDKPKRGEPALFSVASSPDEACKETVKYLISKNMEMAQPTDCASGQVSTVRVVRGGLVDVGRRTVVSFVGNGGNTEVRVKVMQQTSGYFSPNGGKPADEKRENVNANESVKSATDLQRFLTSK